jgi:hypothetical protein
LPPERPRKNRDIFQVYQTERRLVLGEYAFLPDERFMRFVDRDLLGRGIIEPLPDRTQQKEQL